MHRCLINCRCSIIGTGFQIMDIVDRQKRSEMMSKVPRRDTSPEIKIRKILHKAGYRFRVQRKDLPGTPDIVLPKYKIVIFVHGCFWHQHDNCRKSRRPTTRVEFWNEKLDKNIARDKNKSDQLKALGWKVITVWECEIKNKEIVSLAERLIQQIAE